MAALPVFGVEDFRRLPLPAGVVHIQPPNGRTLVNVPTNVYVDADEVVLPTQLLGFPVRVRATPSRYTWRFGDGHAMTTTDRGAPYPRDDHHPHLHAAADRPRRAHHRLHRRVLHRGRPVPADRRDGDRQSPAAALTVVAAENRLTTGRWLSA